MSITILGITIPDPRGTRLSTALGYLSSAMATDTILTPIPPWGKYVIQSVALLIKRNQALEDVTCGAPPNDTDSV